MDQLAWDEEQIFARLAAGALALTVNNRLARYLGARYDRSLAGSGQTAWSTPRLLPVQVWLESSLTELGEDWRLLSDRQSVQLWERVIGADGANELLQLPRTARAAHDAYRLAHEYRLDLSAAALNEDQRAWLRWKNAYGQRLRAGNWLDTASAWPCVLTAVQSGQLTLPQEMLLLGFDELSPHLLNLARTAVAAGCRVANMPPAQTPPGRLLRVPCADADDEVRRAARWTRGLLDRGEQNIGLVVPNLESYRPRIERIFRAELDPQSLLNPAHNPHGFNLSLGRPLSEQGPIAAALELLQIERNMAIEDLSRLLRSPYFMRGTEVTARAQLDRNLRGLRRTQLSFAAVVRLAAKNQGRWRYSHSPELAKRGKELQKFIANRERHRPGDWLNHFLHALQAAGWPGSRGLDSIEYQAVAAWRDKLLPAFSSLDVVSEPLDRRGAVSLLRRLAQEEIFQPEGSSGPVQVLGILEASGLRFDHLWVMGLTADVFPAAARPNPFLPIALQSRLRLPHADPERELAFAVQVTGRLRAAAPEVLFSYPQRAGDSTLRPSPLIAAFPVGTPQLAVSHDPAARFCRERPTLETIDDDHGPALPDGTTATGGTAILKDQALCPFRAFARHRLHAREFEQPEIGLDAMQRGSLVHACLEAVWSRLRDSDRLQQLSEAELDALIAGAVETGLNNELERMPERPGARLLSVERHRLEKLLGHWLRHVDRPRPEFRVTELEQGHQETVGGLNFRVQADRIDTLADGRKFIIDYKTGRVQGADLIGERLLEPQLPIYALHIPAEELAGVAFGVLRGGESQLVGIAAEAELVPGVSGIERSRIAANEGLADWAALTAAWRQRLETLAADFCAGAAAVAPVSRARACRYCDLAGLCRIAELAADADPAAGER